MAMDGPSTTELVARLGSSEDSVRKMAAFRLQSALGDPAFADVFIAEGGLDRLTELVLRASGNTLAYALTSLARLLELDMGWECVSDQMIERAVQLVVTQPLVNILRSAVSVLVAIVSHPQSQPDENSSGSGTAAAAAAAAAATAVGGSGTSGFHALKPAVSVYPQFLEMLVSMLSSAEHLLCANALQLINSLVRDSVTRDSEYEWPKFIKKLQDLGVIKAVYMLMQGSALQDLAPPLLEFQFLTKVMLRKWREVRVDLDKPDHKKALRSISVSSFSNDAPATTAGGNSGGIGSRSDALGSKRNRDPERWRRIGFDSEHPGAEFEHTGFLGMMDLTDFVVKNEDQFRKLILEQANKAAALRCPVARASLAVTLVLYEHFDVDHSESEDSKTYAALESRTNLDKAFKPLLLHWSRLHTAGLNAFLRLWKQTGAEVDDFDKIAELVRILFEHVVGRAARTKDIAEAEEELLDLDLKKLRALQMEMTELTYEDSWGHHLRQVREDLGHEALQFIKEQRIRCLLEGAWFPCMGYGDSGLVTKQNLNRTATGNWRFIRLSHNRRYLHWGDFEAKMDPSPGLDDLKEQIDLSIVSSVVSNVSASPPASSGSEETLAANGKWSNNAGGPVGGDNKSDKDANERQQQQKKGHHRSNTSTKITIHGIVPSGGSSRGAVSPTPGSPTAAEPSSTSSGALGSSGAGAGGSSIGGGTSAGTGPVAGKERVLLQLHPASHVAASEWLDGLLMLLNQKPITADTTKLVNLMASYGLKIRLLNIRYEDLSSVEQRVPSREELDDDYWYDFGGMEAGA